MRLTTAELLKNYFFGRDEYEQYLHYWQNVFETNEEVKKYWDTEIVAGRIRRHFIDLFFYSFLQIKIQDNKYSVKTEDKNQYTKVDGLFDSYKSFISEYKIDKQELIEEIKQYALLFKNNFDIQVLDSELPAENSMDRINAIIFGLENTTIIPYILFILKNVSDMAEQKAMFGFLESYLLRRMVCHSNTKNYNSLFSESLINNEILNLKELKEYIDNRSADNNYLPQDDELERGFIHSRLVNKQATGILYFIESKLRNRSLHSTAMLGLKSYSLEHVMPKKWENNWPAVDTQQEKDKRNGSLMTIGNLTIIPSSLNSSIRDSNWEIKKNGSNSRPGLIQYASGLETFSQYLAEDIWDEIKIQHRANFLFENAKSIWKID